MEIQLSNQAVASGLLKLFQRRSDFVLIGLTGRTGSGCTTVAQLFAKTFQELSSPVPNLQVAEGETDAEPRKYRIAYDYAKEHWHPFTVISVSNVIASFLLDVEETELRSFLASRAAGFKQATIDQLINEWKSAVDVWKRHSTALTDRRSPLDAKASLLSAWHSDLAQFFQVVRRGSGVDSTRLLQLIGDNLRKSGNPLSSEIHPDQFYALPERVADFIDVIRTIQKGKNAPCYVVLDALRNPFEALYFRERFAAFYMFAITAENEDREHRLLYGGLNYTVAQIKALDQKEYPEKNEPLSGYDAFTSQNIQSCLEKADVYIRNNGKSAATTAPSTSELKQQLVRYFSLVLHPGLVTPTRSERCMQIAISARANSGCISRQVGAAITDETDAIKGVGWNDVAAGQVPCLLRRATDLMRDEDKAAFSDYELTDDEFRKQIKSSFALFEQRPMGGRSCAFCFKKEYNTLKKERNQVHTRSLHAEENAFLQVAKHGGVGVKGGRLYSTASPCELCAKKAYQLGIEHIFYIDPYPGISLKQIFRSGRDGFRPTIHLYAGAVGQAYHRLYDPILPFKDEISALMQPSE